MAYAMRKTTSLLLLSFFLLQCISISNGTEAGSAELAATIKSGNGPWCIPQLNTTEEALRANIQYACGGGIANCNAIQIGGPCYFPNTDYLHAAYAMSAYFYAAGHSAINCDFNGTGFIYPQDPSYDNCQYPS